MSSSDRVLPSSSCKGECGSQVTPGATSLWPTLLVATTIPLWPPTCGQPFPWPPLLPRSPPCHYGHNPVANLPHGPHHLHGAHHPLGHHRPPKATTVWPTFPMATTIPLIITISLWPPHYGQPSPWFPPSSWPPPSHYDHHHYIGHQHLPTATTLWPTFPMVPTIPLATTIPLRPPPYGQPFPWSPPSPWPPPCHHGHHHPLGQHLATMATTLRPTLPVTTPSHPNGTLESRRRSMKSILRPWWLSSQAWWPRRSRAWRRHCTTLAVKLCTVAQAWAKRRPSAERR